MAFIDWGQKFSVDIVEIDNQHKKLVSLINELFDGMKSGKSKDILGGVIDNLITYTLEHFLTEEAIFKKFNYSETEEHIAEHQKFVKEVARFKSDLDAKKVIVSLEIIRFLRDWLYDHILKSDKKYVKFMHQNGVK